MTIWELIALILFGVATVGLAIERAWWMACIAAGLFTLTLGSLITTTGIIE